MESPNAFPAKKSNSRSANQYMENGEKRVSTHPNWKLPTYDKLLIAGRRCQGDLTVFESDHHRATSKSRTLEPPKLVVSLASCVDHPQKASTAKQPTKVHGENAILAKLCRFRVCQKNGSSPRVHVIYV